MATAVEICNRGRLISDCPDSYANKAHKNKSQPKKIDLGHKEGKMRVDDNVRKGVVFVGRQQSGSFVAYGTGFITANTIDDRIYQTIVTARHVIDRMREHSDGKLERVDIRLNTFWKGACYQCAR
jgi:hypothetical protein